MGGGWCTDGVSQAECLSTCGEPCSSAWYQDGTCAQYCSYLTTTTTTSTTTTTGGYGELGIPLYLLAQAPPPNTSTVLVQDPDDAELRWRWITTAQFYQDLRSLVEALPRRVRGIAGIPRGGMMAASYAASVLNVPLYALSPNGLVQLPSSGRRLNESDYSGPMVILEDDVFSGITMHRLLDRVEGDVIRAAVYQWQNTYHPVDVCVRSFPCTWLCDWRFFNAGHWLNSRLATDFDGILCHDCSVEDDDDGPRYLNFLRNARPLHLIKPQPIPLLVTARREVYRSETESWLKNHGITVTRLAMGQWPSLAERTLEKVIDLKAGEFERSNLVFFVESCPHQAALIAARVPRPVICPATAQVFNPTKLIDFADLEKKETI